MARSRAEPATSQSSSSSQSVMQDGKVFLGKSVKPEYLDLGLANRHGLVTGATGTGKTVTLQVMAEGFRAAGVPVFAADIKGDLSGISQVGRAAGLPRANAPGDRAHTLQHRLVLGVFWDMFGRAGHPVRATVERNGPAALVAACSSSTSRRRACSTSPSAGGG